MNRKRIRHTSVILLTLAVLFGGYQLFSAATIPTYKVVIDPGHGGVTVNPYHKYGDKYDPLLKKFLGPYREGARHGNHTERNLMLKLGQEVHRILKLTHTASGFAKFEKILRKYSNQSSFPRAKFELMLTRNQNFKKSKVTKYKKKGADVNAAYRHWDYRDKSGKKRLGRISKINRFRPELVVSLHLTPGRKEGGMAAVITPPYSIFNIARKFAFNPKNIKKYKQQFKNSKWSQWMIFTGDRDRFQNFICDAWIYFTGYWSRPDGLRPWVKKWRGYRWNMTSWAYADPAGWEKKARLHKPGLYARDLKQYRPLNKYFERERAKPEYWRRSGGPEGFGGDNFFAAQEIMRFVQFGLRSDVRDKGKPIKISPIRDPYLSTWEIPTYINAVSAFIEIGFINVKHDMKNMTTYRRQLAESIAVGIYSLFTGVKPKKNYGKNRTPLGKRLDFARYRNYKSNYFKMAWK